MSVSRLLLLVLVLLLAACTTIDGTYRPACVAYEGDIIRMSDGRFTWTRFTDERLIDENGDHVDPFPDFPKEGHYAQQGSTLELTMDDENEKISYYGVQKDGDYYLLQKTENDVYLANGMLPDCPLKRLIE